MVVSAAVAAEAVPLGKLAVFLLSTPPDDCISATTQFTLQSSSYGMAHNTGTPFLTGTATSTPQLASMPNHIAAAAMAVARKRL